jgi:ketosteroid isomerase-like protein
MKQLVLFFLVVAFIACNQTTNSPTEAIKAQTMDPALDSARVGIEKAFAAHVAADLKGDAIEAIKVFEDSAVLYEHGAPTFIGRAALENYEIELFKQVKVLEARHEIEGLTRSGNVAYQLGKVFAKMQSKGDNSQTDINARYMAAWRKQADASWRIAYFVYYP